MKKDIRQIKKTIRRDILKQRSAIPESYRKQADDIIKKAVQAEKMYRYAEYVLYYVDFRGEVSTRELMEDAFLEGKKVCVPLTIPETKEMLVCQINSLDCLVKGNYGVLEPSLKKSRTVEPVMVDFVVNPGVAFDLNCQRLGYGGGYYDRFVYRLKRACPRVALAYELQIIDHVPLGVYDVPVDAVITEKRIIRRK